MSADDEWFRYDEEATAEDYYCRDCGKGGLLCMCHSDDDPREYEPEADPKKYDQGREGKP